MQSEASYTAFEVSLSRVVSAILRTKLTILRFLHPATTRI